MHTMHSLLLVHQTFKEYNFIAVWCVAFLNIFSLRPQNTHRHTIHTRHTNTQDTQYTQYTQFGSGKFIRQNVKKVDFYILPHYQMPKSSVFSSARKVIK